MGWFLLIRRNSLTANLEQWQLIPFLSTPPPTECSPQTAVMMLAPLLRVFLACEYVFLVSAKSEVAVLHIERTLKKMQQLLEEI